MNCMSNTSRVDFSQLGFEISVRNPNSNSSNNLGYGQEEANSQEQQQQPQPQPQMEEEVDGSSAYSIQSDEVSDIYATDDDDDSSYGDEEEDDDEEDDCGAGRARQLNNLRYNTRRTSGVHLTPSAACDADDLGYEPMNDLPSTADLGYGDEDEEPMVTKVNSPTPTRVYNLSSSGHSAARNRRSITGGRRMSRFSTCSGTTASSKSSFGGSGKMPRRHSKSRQSQRERLVERSASRRMSRKHPCQARATRRQSYHCSSNPSDFQDDSNRSFSGALHQTLQDLGCAGFIDSTRTPRRLSIEYGTGDPQNGQPMCVSLEFGSNSKRRNSCSSAAVACGAAAMPRRVSIQYQQIYHSNSEPTLASKAGDDHSRSGSPQRVVSRRGSLDFSVGTSTLPRRNSMRHESAAAAAQQHQRHCRHNERSNERSSPKRSVKNKSNSFRIPRRSSCGAGFNATTTITNHAQDNTNSLLKGLSSLPPRTFSGSSGGADATPRQPRRSSLAHIPRKTQTLSPIPTSIRHQHRLSIKNVGSVGYLTRDTLVGRCA